jgi:cytochrome b561-like protein
MTYGNRTDGYPTSSKLLHWLVAISVLTTAPVAIAMTRVSEGPTQDMLFNFHKSLGVLILILMILRLINRLAVGAPIADPGIEPWQKTVSAAVHTRSMCYFSQCQSWAISPTPLTARRRHSSACSSCRRSSTRTRPSRRWKSATQQRAAPVADPYIDFIGRPAMDAGDRRGRCRRQRGI